MHRITIGLRCPRKCSYRTMAAERSFALLPLDARASVFSFLAGGELASFSKLSRGCRGVATMHGSLVDALLAGASLL
jgi:hypothetical protein